MVRNVLEYTILGCPVPYKRMRYRIGMTKYDCPLSELRLKCHLFILSKGRTTDSTVILH
jgi:hypothetical protein